MNIETKYGSLFLDELFIGYVSQVYPDFIRVHFPSSKLLNRFLLKGETFHGGIVGSYVAIEGINEGFLGKISDISILEKERLQLSDESFKNQDFHPIAKVVLNLAFNIYDSVIKRSGTSYPPVGSKVYVAPKKLLRSSFKKLSLKETSEHTASFTLGHLTFDKEINIDISFESLLNRHCCVVGTTGAGKSYTVSRILESSFETDTKMILLDATGEYSSFCEIKEHVESFDVGVDGNHLSYRQLHISDLVALFKPSEKVQLPKLQEAIKSLKLIHSVQSKSTPTKTDENILNNIETTHDITTLTKKFKKREPFLKASRENPSIELPYADFSITSLPYQIKEECVWATGRGKDSDLKFGDVNDTDYGHCQTLISRILLILNQKNYQDIFGFSESDEEEKDLISVVDEFLQGSEKNLLRINLENVPFDFNIREIVVNAVGRHLLKLAREKSFKKTPTIIFLDEAHQFLNKSIFGDYDFQVELDEFDKIAKEGRKYGLLLCLATQMPRDIPYGTLSQIGTFLVHRLINQYDKDAIAHACSISESDTLRFLPVLGEGEAVLLGVNYAFSSILKVQKPKIEPESDTPKINLKT